MAISATNIVEPRVLPRTLAGATVLQIVPSLRATPLTRVAVSAARALVQVGARAIVAGEDGDLVGELNSFGGEWLPFSSTTINPSKLRANAGKLETYLTAERVDIVHAKNAGAAWSARLAANRAGIPLITELPDLPRTRRWLATLYLGALSRGDLVVSHSMFNAGPMIARYGIPIERVSIVPRSIDLRRFDSASIPEERVAELRRTWGIPSGVRVLLVPGQIARRNGHLTLAAAARILIDNGVTGFTFVLAGDDRLHRRFVQKFWRQARAESVDALFRMVGYQADMPAAFAASDFAVIPYIGAPTYGRVAVEAQAMALPVIASSIGPLPENILTPPRIDEELRTGWEVPPGDASELARAIENALALDTTAYRAHAARARQFAEYMFSSQRAAAAALEIYASLLDAAQ